MKLGILGAGLALAVVPHFARAEHTSYHFYGPIAHMYELPVGETPGWSTPTWFNFEGGVANVWNHQASMTDTRNGNQYYYFADYEQESAIAEFGRALTDWWAMALEVPYVNHNGGFMDDAVDRFHQWIQSDRFMRDMSPKFGNHLVIQTNGVNNLSTEHAEGVGNMKAKTKLWLWHLKGMSSGACDCGLAVSAQAKFPLQTRLHGLSSGSRDYSGLVHFGVPIGTSSGAWATAAFTKLGPNDTFAGWPRRDWQQMYELTLNLGAGANFGVILQARAESPLFNKQYLSFNYTTATAEEQLEERVSSGWNYLVEWRGSEDIGIRWRWANGNEIGFLFIEDWGIGTQDQASDGLYINNAPDFQFLSQWHFVF